MTTFDAGHGSASPPDPGMLDARRLPLLLGIYFGLHLLVRLAISTTLALDEAEQVLLSQAFQWGYSGQPPLYAWIQHILFLVLGRNLFALALLKNGLLLLAYLFFWLTARRLWPERGQLVALAVLSWLLIPQIVWEAQRDLSHSVMVLTLASASLYAVARALTRQTPSSPPGVLWYAAFGALMALGLLSKYNFVVFAGALSLALLSVPKGRALLGNPRILISLLVMATLAGPHLVWVADHWDVAVRSLGKVEASPGNNLLLGLGVLLLAGVSFLTPLWLAWMGFFPGLFRRILAGRQGSLSLLVQRYLLVLVVGMAVGVLALGVGHVKERWMIPFLFVAPLHFFSGAPERPLPGGRVRWFRRLAAAAAVAALVVSGFRSLLGPTLGATTRLNYPFDAVARTLEEAGLDREAILAHNAWFGGNLLKRFPGSRAYVPGFVLPDPEVGPGVFVVWDAVRSEDLPEEMRRELADRFGLDVGEEEPRYESFPYRFGAGREARVAFLRLGG